ncbi:MAG: ABC transporter permease subunit [Syntrophaceae bacterium]|nr:ABC transporter permease subunit [Syntrophaceae bacterium]
MKLVWFETLKTFSRWRTYIGFGVIALIVIITEVVMKLSADEILYRMLRSLEKDFLISGNVLNGWFVTAFIMNTLHIHMPFLITLVAGDVVSSEATSGTVRLLLIRPPSRSRIITAKYITTFFYTAGLVLFLGLLCILLGLTLFGSGDLIIHHYGRFGVIYIEEAEIPIRMLFAFMAAIWSMMAVASIAFLLSTLAENSVGPIIGTMAVVVVFLVIGNFPLDFFRSLKPYLFTTYLTFWQQFLDDPIPWRQIGSSAAILGLHSILLFLIALGVYARKDIKS